MKKKKRKSTGFYRGRAEGGAGGGLLTFNSWRSRGANYPAMHRMVHPRNFIGPKYKAKKELHLRCCELTTGHGKKPKGTSHSRLREMGSHWSSALTEGENNNVGKMGMQRILGDCSRKCSLAPAFGNPHQHRFSVVWLLIFQKEPRKQAFIWHCPISKCWKLIKYFGKICRPNKIFTGWL